MRAGEHNHVDYRPEHNVTVGLVFREPLNQAASQLLAADALAAELRPTRADTEPPPVDSADDATARLRSPFAKIRSVAPAVMHRFRTHVDIAVVVPQLLVLTNLIAHFTTPWASAPFLPAAAVRTGDLGAE